METNQEALDTTLSDRNFSNNIDTNNRPSSLPILPMAIAAIGGASIYAIYRNRRNSKIDSSSSSNDSERGDIHDRNDVDHNSGPNNTSGSSNSKDIPQNGGSISDPINGSENSVVTEGDGPQSSQGGDSGLSSSESSNSAPDESVQDIPNIDEISQEDLIRELERRDYDTCKEVVYTLLDEMNDKIARVLGYDSINVSDKLYITKLFEKYQEDHPLEVIVIDTSMPVTIKFVRCNSFTLESLMDFNTYRPLTIFGDKLNEPGHTLLEHQNSKSLDPGNATCTVTAGANSTFIVQPKNIIRLSSFSGCKSVIINDLAYGVSSSTKVYIVSGDSDLPIAETLRQQLTSSVNSYLEVDGSVTKVLNAYEAVRYRDISKPMDYEKERGFKSILNEDGSIRYSFNGLDPHDFFRGTSVQFLTSLSDCIRRQKDTKVTDESLEIMRVGTETYSNGARHYYAEGVKIELLSRDGSNLVLSAKCFVTGMPANNSVANWSWQTTLPTAASDFEDAAVDIGSPSFSEVLSPRFADRRYNSVNQLFGVTWDSIDQAQRQNPVRAKYIIFLYSQKEVDYIITTSRRKVEGSFKGLYAIAENAAMLNEAYKWINSTIVE